VVKLLQSLLLLNQELQALEAYLLN
jgi:hypothetical protein